MIVSDKKKKTIIICDLIYAMIKMKNNDQNSRSITLKNIVQYNSRVGYQSKLFV